MRRPDGGFELYEEACCCCCWGLFGSGGCGFGCNAALVLMGFPTVARACEALASDAMDTESEAEWVTGESLCLWPR